MEHAKALETLVLKRRFRKENVQATGATQKKWNRVWWCYLHPCPLAAKSAANPTFGRTASGQSSRLGEVLRDPPIGLHSFKLILPGVL